MNDSQCAPAPHKRKPGPGRPRSYPDGTGHGAPVLLTRLAPDVIAALRATGDPRATIERLVREHLCVAVDLGQPGGDHTARVTALRSGGRVEVLSVQTVVEPAAAP